MRLAGERIKAARDEKQWSRADVCNRIVHRFGLDYAISEDTIARIERNQGDTAAGTAYMISQILELPIASLFTTTEAEDGAVA
jgi:transcriptional regulator with XRE-family HTH domain